MEEKPYSNREISEKWGDIANSLSRIEIQTTMHNGRMTKVERFQAYTSGAMAVVVLIVVPLLGWALWTLSHFNADMNTIVHKSVDEALASYNIKNE